jgi:formate dehydrogenase major subunit
VTLDPNVQIQESKVASCDIRPGRRPRGPELLALVAEYQARAGTTIETGNRRITDRGARNADPGPGADGRPEGRSG